ncbi:hypothetical protein BOFL111202_26245 [Bordetella flabilis]
MESAACVVMVPPVVVTVTLPELPPSSPLPPSACAALALPPLPPIPPSDCATIPGELLPWVLIFVYASETLTSPPLPPTPPLPPSALPTRAVSAPLPFPAAPPMLAA